MRLSPTGEALIKAFESCEEKYQGNFRAYYCPAKVLTIGWGHTNDHGRRFREKEVWSQKECDDAFTEDMAGFEQGVASAVKVPLNQHQFDALVSFAYNVGMGNLRSSTLLRKLNAGNYDGAALEFHRWNKGGGRVLAGLIRRRASEALVFQGFKDANYDGKVDPPGMAQAVSRPTR